MHSVFPTTSILLFQHISDQPRFNCSVATRGQQWPYRVMWRVPRWAHSKEMGRFQLVASASKFPRPQRLSRAEEKVTQVPRDRQVCVWENSSRAQASGCTCGPQNPRSDSCCLTAALSLGPAQAPFLPNGRPCLGV